jgi:hypothetical protein
MSAPAGWYPDPNLVNTRRYWDGAKWTEHRQELPSAGPTPVTKDDSSMTKVLSVIGVIALTIVAAWFLFGQTRLGSNSVDVKEISTTVEADLKEQGFGNFDLECDDPGVAIDQGDVTYCRGANRRGQDITVKVTFDGDGGYSWESL